MAEELQAKLDGLDVETLQKLLQTAITNKGSPGTTSVVVDQTANSGTTENNDDVENDKIGDGGGAEMQINVGVDVSGQNQIMKDDSLGTLDNLSHRIFYQRNCVKDIEVLKCQCTQG